MIEALLTKEIAIVSTLLVYRVWPLAVVKSRYLRWNLLKNTPLLLVRWQDIQESRYQTFWGAYWWVSFILLAIPGQNNLVSNLLLFIVLAVSMFAQFHLSLSFCCYWQWLLLDDLSVLFFLQVLGAVQFLLKYYIFPQLKHLLSIVTLLLLVFRLLNIIARSPIMSMACLLMNFTSTKDRICYQSYQSPSYFALL